jgi:hypothetical protein
MTYSTVLRSAVCAAALIAGTTAHAELTAAQVWDDWKSQYGQYGGGNLSIGAEETSSGVVNVRDITLSIDEDDVSIITTIEDITFNEQADGSVRVTMDEVIPLVVTGVDGVTITVNMSHENLEINVSGSPELMEYDVTASSYTVAFQDAVDGDVTINGDARLTANDIAATYTVAKGEMRDISSVSSIGTMDLLVDFQIPGGDGEYITAAAKVNGMRSQSEATVPLAENLEDPDDIFANGFSVAGGYIIDSADYVFDINVEGDETAGSVSTGMVTLTGELNAQTVGYDSNTVDLEMNMQTNQFPFPLDITAGEYGTGFRMPLGVSDEPSDFGFKFDLVDLEVSDVIWGLFDPNSVLPRDPATLQIAINGKARALFDMMDPTAEPVLNADGMPFELSSMSLDTLKVMAAGALFTGSGAFSFDNSDTQTFAPLPRPEGDATFEITGLNKLLDNLVAMGLVPEQDIMGPRMMMGMFARSTGDDQMAIDVEVTPSGQVNVNGNRVR